MWKTRYCFIMAIKFSTVERTHRIKEISDFQDDRYKENIVNIAVHYIADETCREKSVTFTGTINTAFP